LKRTAAPHLAAAVAVVLVASACAGSSPSGEPSASPSAPAAELTGGPDWPTYHGDAARTGVLAGQAVRFGSAGLGWTSPQLDGDVYASPIVAAGMVVVATENDTVYGFDSASGSTRWGPRHLADPMNAEVLPCGNIRPITGITGTPVADVEQGRLYVVAFTRAAQHLLFTLDLATGNVLASRRVDPPGESPLTHQQRGALTLANDTVYVTYGGLAGDCGQYHGWVVGAPTGGGDLLGYRVPCGRECGLWAPGGPTADASGDLWVASGNGDSTTRFDYGNAVIRLSPQLKPRDYFAPQNWASLSATDADLGSISPALLDGDLAWISGKDGVGYLLRRQHLGGIGGQAFSSPACPAYGGTAYAAPMLYLSCSGEVAAVRIDAGKPSFSVRWRQRRDAPGAPILAYGALWVVDTGAGTLNALDPNDGHQLFRQSGGAAMHFVTPAASGGRVYAALGRKLLAVAVQA
jgi:polyvinyl alcohol dehydrogenase (cytochrome)